MDISSTCKHRGLEEEANDNAGFSNQEISSFISPFLQSNEVPSDTDELVLRRNLEIVSAHVSTLESRVAKARAFLESLEIQHRDLKDLENKHKSILLPVRRVPTEILSSIFLLSLECHSEKGGMYGEGGKREDLFVEARRRSGPWCLSWTCSRWRAVALNTPSLWATFTLSFSSLSPAPGISRSFRSPNDGHALQLFDLALERAGNQPLDFAFECKSYFKFVRELFHVMLQRNEKWRHVHLLLPGAVWKLALQRNMRFPQLQTFELLLHDEEDVGDIQISAPNLTRVRYHTPYDPHQYFNLPLKQLTHLVLPTRGSALRNLLASAVNLEHLELCRPLGNNHATVHAFESKWITHTKLTTLIMTGSESIAFSNPSQVILPSLSHLTVDVNVFHKGIDTILYDFITNSSISLQSLTLRLDDWNMEGWIIRSECLFSGAPDIKDLNIELRCTEREEFSLEMIFRLLTHDHEKQLFSFKQLERLRITNSKGGVLSKTLFRPGGALIKMIKSRRRSPGAHLSQQALLREFEFVGNLEEFNIITSVNLKELERDDFIVKISRLRGHD
ncbi:hypothetical protein VKT23_019354 [Stygiomarasmius scandens]|uniref:F-box domain-containing protein n=1 Tax=Marasmiellus scandens TaxID=2682957 RepID=A0ABR1IP36_9AGAR